MQPVNQPSAAPTRKFSVFFIGSIASALAPAAEELWAALLPDALAGPDTSYLVGICVTALVAYYVKDLPNGPA